MSQGMPDTSVSTKGFGKTQPVATNDTAQGGNRTAALSL